MSTTTTQNYPSPFITLNPSQTAYDSVSMASSPVNSSPSPKISPASTPPKRAPTETSDFGSSSCVPHEGSEVSSMTSDRDSGSGSNTHDYNNRSLPPSAQISSGGPIHTFATTSTARWVPPNMALPPPILPNGVRPPLFTMTYPQMSPATSAGAVHCTTAGAPLQSVPMNNSTAPAGAHVPPPPPGVPLPSTPSNSPPLGQVITSHPPPTMDVSLNNGSENNHDVFIHVQPGEILQMYVGPDYQNIQGPATIRMVGQEGISALPMKVPPGHYLHQILNEKGHLKHVILSPQTSNNQSQPQQTTSLATLRPGINSNKPPPTTPNSLKPVSNGENVEQTTPNNARKKVAPPKRPSNSQIPPGTSAEINGTSNDKRGNDAFERDRLQNALNRVWQPTVTRIGAFDADVTWLELDTSEAGGSGGPFPNIDTSEFVYEIFLYESTPHGKLLTQSKCPSLASHNGVRLNHLKPRTDYHVAVRALLPERQLIGQLSQTSYFRTLSVYPDQPTMLRVTSRGVTWVNITWNPSTNPTASPANGFLLQLAKGKEPYETVYEGQFDQAKIKNLEPASHYKARVAAQNENGRSEFSPPLHINTNPLPPQQVLPTTSANSNYYQPNIYNQSMGAGAHHTPHHFGPIFSPKLPAPTIVFVSARQVRLHWMIATNDFSNNIILEFSESNRNVPMPFTPVSQDSYQQTNPPSASVSNLKSNREYRFRLSGRAINGDIIKSEPATVKTHKDRFENPAYYNHNNYDRDSGRIPPPIIYKSQEDEHGHVELTWKPAGNDYDVQFNVEGAVSLPKSETGEGYHYEWKLCYKGAATSYTITDPILNLFRIRTVNQRGVVSPWCDHVFVRRKQRKHLVPRQYHYPLQHQQPLNQVQSPPPQQYKASVQTVTKPAEPEEVPPPAPEVIKPPTCSQPTLSNIKQFSVHVSWSLTEEFKKNQKKPFLLYELQRVDKEPSSIVYSGDDTKFDLENLRPVEHIQLRVRSVIVDNEGQRIKGEWSSIVSVCTPCSVTSAPQNLRLKNDEDQHVLLWDTPALTNGADVIEYFINSANMTVSESTKAPKFQKIWSTDKTEFVLENLIPAHFYVFNVVARNEAGISEPSNQFSMTSPVTVPSAPGQVDMETLALESLHIFWTASESNGADIEDYRVVLYSDRKVVDQVNVTGLEHTFINLKAYTEYTVEVSAKNEVGWSKSTSKTGKTLDVPPEPPVLSIAQVACNALKLKWANNASTSEIDSAYYYLEKESENGKFMAVYEGENRTAKVRQLKEASTHRFRIRASYARAQPTLAGPWSSVYSFQTSSQPPAAIKNAPTITEIAGNVYQIEWLPYKSLSANGDEDVNYLLQVVSKAAKGSEGWKNIYQGPATAFTWTMPLGFVALTGTKQARVLVVQNKQGEEVHSVPSPVAMFHNNRSPSDSPRKRPNKTTSGASTPTSAASNRSRPNGVQARVVPPVKLSLYKRFKRFLTWLKRSVTERDWAFLVLTLFVVVALVIAVLVNSFYEM